MPHETDVFSSDYILSNVPGTLVPGLFSHMALCVFISTLDPLDMRMLAVGFLAKAEDSMRKNTGSDLLGMRAGVMPLSSVPESFSGSDCICLYSSQLSKWGAVERS